MWHIWVNNLADFIVFRTRCFTTTQRNHILIFWRALKSILLCSYFHSPNLPCGAYVRVRHHRDRRRERERKMGLVLAYHEIWLSPSDLVRWPNFEQTSEHAAREGREEIPLWDGPRATALDLACHMNIRPPTYRVTSRLLCFSPIIYENCIPDLNQLTSAKFPSFWLATDNHVLLKSEMTNLIKKSANYVVMAKRRFRVTKTPSPDLPDSPCALPLVAGGRETGFSWHEISSSS